MQYNTFFLLELILCSRRLFGFAPQSVGVLGPEVELKVGYIHERLNGFLSSRLAIAKSRENSMYDSFAVEGFLGFSIIIISATLRHLETC